MLVIDVGDKYVGDNFEMLVTDLRFWWRIKYIKNHQHNENSRQHNNSVTNILNLSPSLSHKHNAVTNIIIADQYSRIAKTGEF